MRNIIASARHGITQQLLRASKSSSAFSHTLSRRFLTHFSFQPAEKIRDFEYKRNYRPSSSAVIVLEVGLADKR